MRTYYRGPDALVTSEHLVWHTTPEQVFAIRELHRVGISHRRTRPRLWTLHAAYRGNAVILYQSTSTRVFNQVIRALRRSFEAAYEAA